ncbi:MAG: hypothetical protein M0P97_03365, partial [Candidatus Moranbacteria bacterium]|nr:hypothetical protein [Candidatus Moranbacteria bacterium]
YNSARLPPKKRDDEIVRYLGKLKITNKENPCVVSPILTRGTIADKLNSWYYLYIIREFNFYAKR